MWLVHLILNVFDHFNVIVLVCLLGAPAAPGIYIYIYIYLYICIYIYIYIERDVCIYIYIYTDKWTCMTYIRLNNLNW